MKRPGFFAYLFAIVAPPLSLFAQGKIFAGIISLVLMFIAIPFFFVFGFGIIIWFAMACWAMISLGNKAADAQSQHQADLTAKAIVEAQRKEKSAAA